MGTPSLAGLPESRALPPRAVRNMRASVLDGAFAQLMASLTSGFLLTGFAVALGAGEAEVGLLAAMPALGNLGQLAGPAVIARLGSRKRTAVVLAAAGRALWAVAMLLPFLPGPRVPLLMAAVGLAGLLGAVSGVAWMSWMADLVPEEVRGRFFGHRNAVATSLGMAATWLGGQFVDAWRRGAVQGLLDRLPGSLAGWLARPGAEFSVLYAAALAAGAVSLHFLRAVDEPPASEPPAATGPPGAAGPGLAQVLADDGFRRLVVFGMVWNFAVGFGGPFIDLYMIQTLQVPFGVLALFGVVNGLSTVAGMRLWGGFSDRWGTLPALALSGLGAAVLPLVWALATPTRWGVLWAANALSGFSWAGVGLVSSTMLMKMAPRAGNTAYFAAYTALTGAAGAVAPAVGGAVASALAGRQLWLGSARLEGLQILFLMTAAARLAALSLLRQVRPPRERSPEELLRVLADARARLVQPVMAAGQWAQYGMSTADNLSAALARGSLVMEARLEAAVQAGEAWLARADRAWSRRVDRLEAASGRLIDALFDRLDPVLARLRRWWRG